MISITQATKKDIHSIIHIGKLSIVASHRESCSADDMNEYLENNYNPNAIKQELTDNRNIYHIINYQDEPIGFSKIVFNAKHPNIEAKNITKLDRIYLLEGYYGLKLGLALLNFTIELSKRNKQSGMWLYTWIGNSRAINFYQKAGFTIVGKHSFYVTKTHYDESHQMFLNYLNPK